MLLSSSSSKSDLRRKSNPSDLEFFGSPSYAWKLYEVVHVSDVDVPVQTIMAPTTDPGHSSVYTK
jgi:hypothetical protein